MLLFAASAWGQSPFTHRIPINVPRGANGLQPDVSLVYAPGAGNGILGLGWQLTGIPTISRMNYENAIQNTDADTYVHSELGVLVKQADGSYRSKKDSFVKLVPTNGCGGPCSWLAYLPSGGKMLFWKPTGSGVWVASNFDDGSGRYWEVWYDSRSAEGHAYPARIVYTKGPGLATYRTVELEYEARPDVEPSYANGSLDKVTQRLKWIRVRSGVTDQYGYGGTLVRKYRLDYQTTGNASLTRRSQLVSVQEYGSNGDDAGCAALPAPTACALPAQTFTYSAETAGAQIPGGAGGWGTFGWAAGTFPGAGGRYRFGDFNGDGKADVLYIAEGGGLYVNLSGSTSTSGVSSWGAFGDGAWENLGRYQLGDFNGDGKADVLWVGHDPNAAGGDTHLHVALSTGTRWVNGVANSGFVGRGDWGIHGNGNDLGRYRIADYDGDGKADVGFIGGDGYFGIAYSSGSGFPTYGGAVVGRTVQSYLTIWGSRVVVPVNKSGEIARFRIADFNGDGKADVLFIAPNNELWVSLASGRTLAAPTAWVNSANSGQLAGWVDGAAWGNGNDLERYQFGDFNGDGKTDLMFIGSAADVHIRAATGSAFAPDQYCDAFGDGAPSRYQIADFNADGRSDILFIASDTKLYIRVANGMSFAQSYLPSALEGFGNGNDLLRYFVMDFTGDGKADVLFVGGENPEANLTLGKTVADEPMLTKVENGIGGTITVAYAQAADVPGVIVPPAWDPVTGVPAWWQANVAPRLLVTQATTSDGRGGSTSVAYAYGDGRVYPGTPSVRRDLGFAWTVQADASTGATTKTRTVTTYNQSPGIEGTAARVEEQAYNGTSWVTVRAQAHEFHAVAPAGTQGIEFVRDELQTVETHEPNEAGRLVSAQTTRATYDDYGNVLSKVQCAGTLVCVTVSMTYQNDATNWLLRRLETTTTSSGGLTLAAAKNVWSGRVVVETSEWLDTTNAWRVTTLGYDASGNLASVTRPDTGDGIRRVTTTEYDATYRAQPARLTNAGGHVTSSTYLGDGNVSTATGANGNTVTFTYDVFGRKRTESGPGARYNEWSYLAYGDPNAQRNRQVTWVNASRTLWREEYFDGVGFKYGVTSSGDCATWVVENVEKDGNGRPARTTKPYCYGTTPTWTHTSYDLAGRVSSVATQSPDGAWHATTYRYASAAASTTDENGQVTTRYFDARDRTTRVVDAANQATSYGYDPLGRLIWIQPPDNSVTRIFYDSLNRRTRVEEPQVAATTYAYDSVDNVTMQVTRGKGVTFMYDALNRVVRKQPAGEAAVTYTYDEAAYANGRGRLTTQLDASGVSHYSYTASGQVAASTKTIDGRTYTQASTYDRAGWVTQITYPDGSRADYGYTPGGNLATLTLDGVAVAAWGAYDAAGRPGQVVYGNNVDTRYAYDWAEHLTTLTTKSGATVLQDLAYDWYGRPNTGGLNIAAIRDNRANKIALDSFGQPTNTDETQTYTYDALYRLTQAVGVWGTKSYGYSPIGNPTAFGGLTARTLTFVGQQVRAGTNLSNVTYDAATGAMTGRVLDGVASAFAWTAEGRLASVTKNGALVAQMTYDADGHRTKKVYTPAAGPTVTTIYATPMYEVRTFSDGTPQRHTLHLFATGQLVASVTKTGNITVAANNPTQWRTELAIGAMYDAASLEGAAKKLVQLGRAVGAFRPAARWAGWTLFLVAAAWLLATTLSSLRRRGHRGGFSPLLRLTATGTVLALGLTACNAGPAGLGVSTDPVLSGDTLEGPPPGTYFYHRNHINSGSVVTDYLGAEVSRYVYLPFGELSQANSTGADTATRKYTGQEHDEETGLYYYNARYYDPAIGRFLSPDTVVPNVSDGQALNRYSYVRNNPVIYTDPSGHSWKQFTNWVKDHARVIAAVAIVVASVVATIATGGTSLPLLMMTMGEITGGISALSQGGNVLAGVLVGGIVGLASGYAGGLINTGVGSMLVQVGKGALQGAIFGAGLGGVSGYAGGAGSLADVLRSAAIGAAIGAATGALRPLVFGREITGQQEIHDYLGKGAARLQEQGMRLDLTRVHVRTGGLWGELYEGWAKAGTLGNTINVDLGWSGLGNTITHELVHVWQYQSSLMGLDFFLSYTWQLILNGYGNNPYEVAARGAAGG